MGHRAHLVDGFSQTLVTGLQRSHDTVGIASLDLAVELTVGQLADRVGNRFRLRAEGRLEVADDQ